MIFGSSVLKWIQSQLRIVAEHRARLHFDGLFMEGSSVVRCSSYNRYLIGFVASLKKNFATFGGACLLLKEAKLRA
jgi:hypothetical protein